MLIFYVAGAAWETSANGIRDAGGSPQNNNIGYQEPPVIEGSVQLGSL